MKSAGSGGAGARGVAEAAIAKVVKGAKFDKATVDALRATAKAANDAMRVLDSFTGGEFADAMALDPKTGVIDWDKNNPVGKAVENALDKQQALSNALLKLINNLPANATADQQAALEEAMLQCDRRLAAESCPILTGLDNSFDSRQELTRINRAVNWTADALGLGDVMVKTTAGLTKFLMPPAMAKLYMDRVRRLSIAYGTGSKLAVDAVTSDPGFRKLSDGSIEIDVSKAKSPLTVSGLYHSTAFHHVTVPDEMDFDLCQQLKGLKVGPGRDALLKDWADRLGGTRSPQYRNAVVRLDEAIARAEQLEQDGKVYRAEDWESDAVERGETCLCGLRRTGVRLPWDMHFVCGRCCGLFP